MDAQHGRTWNAERLAPGVDLLLSTICTFLLPLVSLLILQNIWETILSDYYAFISLGPGGTPASPVGYARIKFLSIFALRDPYSPACVPIHFKQQTGCLEKKLVVREGERPRVRGIAPHRQTDQRPQEGVFDLLRQDVVTLSQKYSHLLVQKTSCLEKHGPGLFVRNARQRTPHCNGEVCHAHPSDGSLHLTLHPADAAKVLMAGWGERHPLSSGGWFLSKFVPDGFIMVYAPRTREEIEVVMKIVRAAVWWVGGVDLDLQGSVGQNETTNGKVYDETETEWAATCPDPKQNALIS